MNTVPTIFLNCDYHPNLTRMMGLFDLFYTTTNMNNLSAEYKHYK